MIERRLPEKQKQYVFRKALKTSDYLERCEKNLMAADDKISMESPDHHVIANALYDIRRAMSSISVLISRTKP